MNKGLVLLVIGVVVTFTGGYLIWQTGRSINYAFGYESRVQGTICEMVKPEYLKDPKECE